MKKTVPLDAVLVAVKGKAAPAADAPTRGAAPVAAESDKPKPVQPLNFRVDEDFAYEFKCFAVKHKMKQNELLRRAFDAIRKQYGE